MKITLEHGSGGRATSELINDIFAKCFDNEILRRMEDSAVIEGQKKMAFTTDSFVVSPLFYDGGDIGRLSVCGTVNDLLVSGAVPKYLTCAFIIEEGAESSELTRICQSMAECAKEAGVIIVSGDTKVVEGKGGIMINTSGIGLIRDGVSISADEIREGDAVIVSGNLGDHHAAILKSRMNIENGIKSDNAPLCEMTDSLFEAGLNIHEMRDVTRGGLATVLREISDKAAKYEIELSEEKIPVCKETADFCSLLGLDPLYMGNEGKMVVFLPESESERALDIIKKSRYGEDAAIIGKVTGTKTNGDVILRTWIGGKRRLDVLQGEGLPRIC